MKRFDCLGIIAGAATDALVVTSAGAVTLEWNALRPSDGNFRVRTLGLCSSIALGMARAAGIRQAVWTHSVEEFARVAEALNGHELFFIGAKITTERTEVPPYPMDEVENKYRFIRHVEKTEKIAILK